jgi:septal ring factor EnvC (AmiA/AmiB activator)
MARIERESINFKLPKPLADALRAKAAELNTTATDLVIQGLHHVLGDVPGVETSVEVRLYQIEEEFFSFKSSIGESTNPQQETRLTSVEAKLEALTNQLARFEGALIQMQSSINASKSRSRSSYAPDYNAPPPQLEPHDELLLARRLNTNAAALTEQRTTLSSEEFVVWSRERDFSKNGWRYDEKSKLYYPVK